MNKNLIKSEDNGQLNNDDQYSGERIYSSFLIKGESKPRLIFGFMLVLLFDFSQLRTDFSHFYLSEHRLPGKREHEQAHQNREQDHRDSGIGPRQDLEEQYQDVIKRIEKKRVIKKRH